MQEEHFLTFGVIELPDNRWPVIQSKENAVATITIQLPNEFGFEAFGCIPYFEKEGDIPKVREDKSSANYKEHFDVAVKDGWLKIQPKSGMIFVADSENIDDTTVKYINDRLFWHSVLRYTWNKSNFCSFSIKKI